MPHKIVWEDSFSTGIADIDSQHQELVALINALVDAIHHEERHGQIRDILQRLKEYTQYHFDSEERLMEDSGYAKLPEHRMEHLSFVDQIMLFDLDVILATEGLAWDMLHFLQQWLTTHILVTDKDFASSTIAR